MLNDFDGVKKKAVGKLPGALDRYDKAAVMKKVMTLYAEAPARP